jgi:hypothetical protein
MVYLKNITNNHIVRTRIRDRRFNSRARLSCPLHLSSRLLSLLILALIARAIIRLERDT